MTSSGVANGGIIKISGELLDKLLYLAGEARARAYAPYSHFPVGAALLSASGRIYQGCNVENASFGLTVCAERVALWKAVSEGEREFVAMAVVGGDREVCFPCGACRQVLAEFNPRLKIVTGQPGKGYVVRHLEDLLPEGFVLEKNP